MHICVHEYSSSSVIKSGQCTEYNICKHLFHNVSLSLSLPSFVVLLSRASLKMFLANLLRLVQK